MNLIKDSELIKIPIKENGEKLVSVKDACPKIKIGIAQYIIDNGYEEDACLVREEVANKLNLAQENLILGLNIVLRCGHRALKIQEELYNKRYEIIKKENPSYDEKKLREETSKCVAPIDIVPPHSTGGAIDIYLVDSNGNMLDMGTNLGEFNEKTYTDSREISKEQRENRSILINAMNKAGFINYPTEWWHWSYGDRYWAAELKKDFSIYDGK